MPTILEILNKRTLLVSQAHQNIGLIEDFCNRDTRGYIVNSMNIRMNQFGNNSTGGQRNLFIVGSHYLSFLDNPLNSLQIAKLVAFFQSPYYGTTAYYNMSNSDKIKAAESKGCLIPDAFLLSLTTFKQDIEAYQTMLAHFNFQETDFEISLREFLRTFADYIYLNYAKQNAHEILELIDKGYNEVMEEGAVDKDLELSLEQCSRIEQSFRQNIYVSGSDIYLDGRESQNHLPSLRKMVSFLQCFQNQALVAMFKEIVSEYLVEQNLNIARSTANSGWGKMRFWTLEQQERHKDFELALQDIRHNYIEHTPLG